MTVPTSDRPVAPARWWRITAWILAISYGVGGPWMAVLEFRNQLFSTRFDWPPALIYVTCVIQFACAFAVLMPRFASLAAAGLTVTTLGAVVSHFRIGSPLTSIPAVLYTALQVWFGLAARSAVAADGSATVRPARR